MSWKEDLQKVKEHLIKETEAAKQKKEIIVKKRINSRIIRRRKEVE